jgi:pSer/pThr/pTyr-binding forkhead associated (FHA) protein
LSLSLLVSTLRVVLCPRCGHENPRDARFCSSCGAPLPGDESTTTLALTAVEAAEDTDDLARFLDGLPPGVGLLVVRHGPNAGSSFRVEAARTTIGRHPDSDIFLDDITVSRRHVAIDKTGNGSFHLHDVGSLNGTYVNHERVDDADLHHGDEVQIGKYRLSFVLAS